MVITEYQNEFEPLRMKITKRKIGKQTSTQLLLVLEETEDPESHDLKLYF